MVATPASLIAGVLSAEFFLGPTWSVLYTSFGQISSLLSFPILIVSFTLLYFDSRVRKEAYDLDLIAREINPGFIWQPTVQPSAFGYQMPAQVDPGRAYVQTSPLGLAGYRPSQPRTEPASSERAPRTESEELRDKFQRAAENLSVSDAAESVPSSEWPTAATCGACGASLLPGASFCMNCGSLTR